MRLLSEEYCKGVDLCLENADTWLNEGNILFENRSYGHACALWINGLEALIQAYYTWLVSIKAISPTNPDFLKVFEDHKIKYTAFYEFILTRAFLWSKSNDKEDLLKERYESLIKNQKMFYHEKFAFSNLIMDLRKKGIYVNYDKEKAVFIPPKDLSQERVSAFGVLVKYVSDFIIAVIKNSSKD